MRTLKLATWISPPTAGAAGRGFSTVYSPYAVGWTRYSPKLWSITPVMPVTVSPPRKLFSSEYGSPLPGCTRAAGFWTVEESSIVIRLRA